jgi:hypothetical protein
MPSKNTKGYYLTPDGAIILIGVVCPGFRVRSREQTNEFKIALAEYGLTNRDFSEFARQKRCITVSFLLFLHYHLGDSMLKYIEEIPHPFKNYK